MVSAMNVTHAAKGTVLAPTAVADSGELHLVVMRDVSCCTMVQALLALDDGSVRTHLYVCMCVFACV